MAGANFTITSEILELVLDFLFNLLGSLLEVWLGDFSWSDTTAHRSFWGIILVLLGGFLWRELHSG